MDDFTSIQRNTPLIFWQIPSSLAASWWRYGPKSPTLPTCEKAKNTNLCWITVLGWPQGGIVLLFTYFSVGLGKQYCNIYVCAGPLRLIRSVYASPISPYFSHSIYLSISLSLALLLSPAHTHTQTHSSQSGLLQGLVLDWYPIDCFPYCCSSPLYFFHCHKDYCLCTHISSHTYTQTEENHTI